MVGLPSLRKAVQSVFYETQSSLPVTAELLPPARNIEEKQHIVIACQGNVCYTPFMGNHRGKGGFTPLVFCGGYNSPPDERKEGDTMITYQDFFLFCTFIVALISLLYQIFKGKK